MVEFSTNPGTPSSQQNNAFCCNKNQDKMLQYFPPHPSSHIVFTDYGFCHELFYCYIRKNIPIIPLKYECDDAGTTRIKSSMDNMFPFPFVFSVAQVFIIF